MTNGQFFENLPVGMSASLARTITEADILLYSAVSMDTNPMHLDAAFPKHQIFGQRIAHGMPAAELISAVLGARLTGPRAIYLRQSLRFALPVKISRPVTAAVEVTELNPDKKPAPSRTVCTVGDDLVVEGEAYVQVPSRG
jgi:3-hydroxybutyryl-CoA dehydratase